MSESNTPYTPAGLTPGATPSSGTPKTNIDPSKILPQLRQAFPGAIKDPNMYSNLAAAVTQQNARAQFPQFGYTQQFGQPYQQPTYSR